MIRPDDTPTVPMNEPPFLPAFAEALARAGASAPGVDPTAAALATADARGRPSVRIVLVKVVDARGFVFFTNRASRKGHDLSVNPRAALCFHWPSIGEQVRAEGAVELLPDGESDAYFASRPRAAQLGAWASRQSQPLESRAALDEAVGATRARFDGEPVPRPDFWGGYLLRPERVELWVSAESRLHHRSVYIRDGERWSSSLLWP
jgi:pyridoxamine 5'-phosphate oxidase